MTEQGDRPGVTTGEGAGVPSPEQTETAATGARCVLVTGGSSGLGAAIVRRLADRGDRPVVVDVKPPESDVPWVEADLADPEAASDSVEAVTALGGHPDAVVTAAGIDVCGRLDEVALEDWVRVVTVDLIGTAAVIRAALPHLRATHGRVVTVASTLGLRGVGDATAYCAAKFGVVGFTRALAAETAGEVGVTLLVPGGMRTAFFDGRTEQYRPGPDADLNDPDHVAAAVAFALDQPAGCEVRELLVCAPGETSWP